MLLLNKNNIPNLLVPRSIKDELENCIEDLKETKTQRAKKNEHFRKKYNKNLGCNTQKLQGEKTYMGPSKSNTLYINCDVTITEYCREC